MKKISLMAFVLTLGVFLLHSSVAAAAGCPEAKAQLDKKDFATAEITARQCVEDDPKDVNGWLLLSQALGAQKKYAQAISWNKSAQAQFPDNLDLVAQRIKLMAWEGDLESAESEVAYLPDNAFEHHDVALIAADVAFWREKHRQAVRRYTRYLSQWPDNVRAQRNRAISYKETNRIENAYAELDRLCKDPINDEKSCEIQKTMETEYRKATYRYRMLLRPGYWMSTRSYKDSNVEDDYDGFSGLFLFEARVWDQLRLGVSYEYRSRDYGDGNLDDSFVSLFGSYRWPAGFVLSAGGGMTVDETDFSPDWMAEIEPGWIFDFGLELYFKYWRLEFENSGVNVLSPALIYYIGPAMFYVRYYHAIDDDPDVDSSNSIIGKIGFTIADVVTISGGGGAGDRADYLELTNLQTDSYWLVMAGLGFNITWQHGIFLDYVYRDETSKNDRIDVDFIQHEFFLTYQVKF